MEQFLKSRQWGDPVERKTDTDQIPLLGGMEHGPGGIERMDCRPRREMLEFVQEVGECGQLTFRGLLIAVGRGKVGGETVDRQSCFQDGLEGRHGFLGEGTEAAHAGIDLEVDWGSLRSMLGEKGRFLGGGKGGDESVATDFPVFRGQGGTQKEDRDTLQRFSELNGLSQGSNGKDFNPAVEDTDNFLESMTVGVGLHHGHDPGLSCEFPHGFQIVAESGPVDLNPGAVGSGGSAGFAMRHRFIMPQVGHGEKPRNLFQA